MAAKAAIGLKGLIGKTKIGMIFIFDLLARGRCGNLVIINAKPTC